MKTDKIIYQLTIEDIQRVAKQELERELTMSEVEQLENCIAENIDWYNSIAESIEEMFGNEFYRNN